MTTSQEQPRAVAGKPRPSFQFIGKAHEVLAALRDYYVSIGRA